MITKLDYDKDGFFQLKGIIKNEYVNFDRGTADYKSLFGMMVDLFTGLKLTVREHLADDNRILADERLQVIGSIDDFLIPLLSIGFLNYGKKDSFVVSYGDGFEIQATLERMQYLGALGKLVNVSAEDIGDYGRWMEQSIGELFRRLIQQYTRDARGEETLNTYAELLCNVFVFRYKVEYV